MLEWIEYPISPPQELIKYSKIFIYIFKKILLLGFWNLQRKGEKKKGKEKGKTQNIILSSPKDVGNWPSDNRPMEGSW
jgi:hypothetical protein